MVQKTFLSIITINYNNKEGLRKTIESVRSQTFTDYEHIIIDGGSTDGSVDVIKEALGNEEYASHVSYWCSEKDGGIYPAMNKGIRHASGEFVYMLNSGDALYPWTCTKYETNCMDCPALPNSVKLLAHNQLLTKAANYSYVNPDIFSSSFYDLDFAKKAIIKFKNFHQIYYPIDENIFMPSSINNKKDEVTLFANVNSVGDPRKGFNYLLLILLNLDKRLSKKVRFLCLSNEKYQAYAFKNIYFEEFEFCKNVNDLVSLYQKTDVFLCASIEDSAPMMLQEALLCGVPAISFDTGIGKQFIEDGKQGYVVPRYDVKEFENKLYTLIENKPESIQTSQEIHNHMVDICGKKRVEEQLKELLRL